jgi:hypothetical protein
MLEQENYCQNLIKIEANESVVKIIGIYLY